MAIIPLVCLLSLCIVCLLSLFANFNEVGIGPSHPHVLPSLEDLSESLSHNPRPSKRPTSCSVCCSLHWLPVLIIK